MSRRGFTIIELLIVVAVGGILTTFVMVAFGNAQGHFAVRQARNTFASLHARARAQAIEFGTTTSLHVDAAGDSVWITRNDTTLETISFVDQFGVDLDGADASFELCMSPRGFGDSSCTSISGLTTLAFKQGDDEMYAQMLPLGQLKLPGNR